MVDEYDAFSNDYIGTEIVDGLNAKNGPGYELQPWEALSKGFWGSLKTLVGGSRQEGEGSLRLYITGVSPCSLADNTSGFNIQRNVSFAAEFAGFCGLTKEEVQEALSLIFEDKGPDAAQFVAEHITKATNYFNGYHFCNEKAVQTVLNTNTCLEYLHAAMHDKIYKMPSNSEVSENILKVLSRSNTLHYVLQKIFNSSPGMPGIFKWGFSFKTHRIVDSFQKRDLANVNNDRSVWLSLMVYLGGFTFDPEDPCEKLRVPNLIAAERFAHAVLPRFVGEMDSLKAAFEACMLTGDVLGPLKHVQKLMCQIDIHYKHFEHGEDIHRNRFCCCTNFYPYLMDPVPEFSIGQNSERIDLVIGQQSSKHMRVVTEWKCLQIDYLNIPRTETVQTDHVRLQKAKTLSDMTIDEVLDIKFASHDKYHPRGKSIKDWIEGKERVRSAESPAEQLACYLGGLLGDEGIRAYLIVVVGSRRVLVWEMDVEKRTLNHQPCLADWSFDM
ncbi:putative AAA-ATPase domain containing protein [Elaphomyces granulatus]